MREVLGLKKDQVDLDAGTLTLHPGLGKTGEPRIVYLRPETLAMLGGHLDRVRELEKSLGRVFDFVFPCFPGSGVGSRFVGRQRDDLEGWKTASRKAGYPKVLIHDLRRSGIRNLVRAGVSETVVMRVSGHRSATTFRRYNITSEQDLQAATAKLDAAVGTTSSHTSPVRVLPSPQKRTAISS